MWQRRGSRSADVAGWAPSQYRCGRGGDGAWEYSRSHGGPALPFHQIFAHGGGNGFGHLCDGGTADCAQRQGHGARARRRSNRAGAAGAAHFIRRESGGHGNSSACERKRAPDVHVTVWRARERTARSSAQVHMAGVRTHALACERAQACTQRTHAPTTPVWALKACAAAAARAGAGAAAIDRLANLCQVHLVGVLRALVRLLREVHERVARADERHRPVRDVPCTGEHRRGSRWERTGAAAAPADRAVPCERPPALPAPPRAVA
jgi:hypothetical protein